MNLSTPIPEICPVLFFSLRQIQHLLLIIYKSRKSEGLCSSSFFFAVDSRYSEVEVLSLLQKSKMMIIIITVQEKAVVCQLPLSADES